MASNRPRRRRREENEPEAPQKNRLNNMEMLGIGLFCFAFILYALSKCGEEPAPENPPIVTEEVVDTTSTATMNQGMDSTQSAYGGDNMTGTGGNGGTDTIFVERKLYILADSLRMRKEPKIGGEVVAYLSYGEEVIDLGERTVLEKIRVSVDEIRTAPWIKIETADGRVGWAFGAYMQFYPVPTQTNLPAGNN